MERTSKLLNSLSDSAVSTILSNTAITSLQDILPLAGGEPCFPIQEDILSFNDFDPDLITKYSPFKGYELLLQLIQKKLYEINHSKVGLDEIIVVPGGAFAIFASLMAIINPGDEILVSDPCWEHYINIIQLCRAVPIRFNMLFDGNRYRVDINHLQSVITFRTKAVLLNTPLNPLGSVLLEEEIQEINRLLKRKEIWLIVDEEYESFYYGNNRHFSIRSLEKETISLFSFSKSFSLTGIRLGYIVAPLEIIKLIQRFGLYSYMYPPSPSQYIAINLLSRDNKTYLEEIRNIYQKKLDRFYKAIKKISGIDCWYPEGGVYLFPKLDIQIDNIVERLMNEFHLLCVPGYVSGQLNPKNIRLFIGVPDNQIDEAALRLTHFMEKYRYSAI